jgi:hypothetical protein
MNRCLLLCWLSVLGPLAGLAAAEEKAPPDPA